MTAAVDSTRVGIDALPTIVTHRKAAHCFRAPPAQAHNSFRMHPRGYVQFTPQSSAVRVAVYQDRRRNQAVRRFTRRSIRGSSAYLTDSTRSQRLPQRQEVTGPRDRLHGAMKDWFGSIVNAYRPDSQRLAEPQKRSRQGVKRLLRSQSLAENNPPTVKQVQH